MTYYQENPFASNVITPLVTFAGTFQFFFPDFNADPSISPTIDCSQFQGMRFNARSLSDPGWVFDLLWFDDAQGNEPVADRQIVLGPASLNQNIATVTVPHMGDYLTFEFRSLDGLNGTASLMAAQRQNGVEQWAPTNPVLLGPFSGNVNNGTTTTVFANSGLFAGPAVVSFLGPVGGVGSSVTLEELDVNNVWREFFRAQWVAALPAFLSQAVMLPPCPVRAKLTNGSGANANMQVALVADNFRCGG